MAHSESFGPILITLVLFSLVLDIILVNKSLKDFTDDSVINKTALSPVVAGLTFLIVMFGLQFECYNKAAKKPGYVSKFPTFSTIGVLSVLCVLWLVAMVVELADYIPRRAKTKGSFDDNTGSIDETLTVVLVQACKIAFVISGMIALATKERKRKLADDTISMSTIEHPLARASSNE
ncbi:hypothetical protein DL96DRAFT_1818656, partial [Flagelloscypha sp. PMI_526]